MGVGVLLQEQVVNAQADEEHAKALLNERLIHLGGEVDEYGAEHHVGDGGGNEGLEVDMLPIADSHLGVEDSADNAGDGGTFRQAVENGQHHHDHHACAKPGHTHDQAAAQSRQSRE